MATMRTMRLTVSRHDDEDVRRQYEEAKQQYLRSQRELLGWAVFVGWKRGTATPP
jgi:hypothetical protein